MPEVVNLGEKYAGKIDFVRVNVDDSAARKVLQAYGVRATPTFVLLDANGQVLANVPGYPGYDQFVKSFDQLLNEG